MSSIKLKIADIIIQLKSKSALEGIALDRDVQDAKEYAINTGRFKNFYYRGSRPAEISITINITPRLPKVKADPIFITTHFQDKQENWRLLKKGNSYIYKSTLKDKKQVMLINSKFNRITAFLPLKKCDGDISSKRTQFIQKHNGYTWSAQEIIYDFLQVLLINYLSLYQKGMIVHSIGLKDTDGSGLLFAGKSGAGKSTTARIWHKHSKAIILNDDRVIIRKKRNRFFIYGSPWHGDFNDYLESRIETAPLKQLFFIHHSPKNSRRKIYAREAFSLLFPSLFPAFWERRFLEKISTFSLEVLKKVPCYNLGFINNKKIIKFIRDTHG